MNIKQILKEQINTTIVDKLLTHLNDFNTPNINIFDKLANPLQFKYFVPIGDTISITGYDEEENKSFPDKLLNIFNTAKDDENLLVIKEYTTRKASKGKGFNDLENLRNYAETNRLENVYDVSSNTLKSVAISKLIPDFGIVKTKDDVTYPQDLLSRLTLNGDMVTLYHYGSPELENGVLDPKFYGTHNYTTSTGGIDRIFFYIDKNDKERMVGGKEYIVQVPLKDIYPFNSDPLNFYNDAVKAYGSETVPVARQMAYITSQALKYGFEGMFFRWENSYRADYFSPIKPLNI